MKNTISKNIARVFGASYAPKTQIVLAASMLGFGSIGIAPAQAATFTYSGDTTGAPTWNRPEQGNPPITLSSRGTATPYDVFSFTVDTSSSYVFASTSPYDNYGFLYQGAFNAAISLANVIIGDDDSNPSSSQDYKFTTNLTTGTNYFLVSTGFDNTEFGAFTTTIDGAGNVNPTGSTSVPEPFTIVGTLVGGTAALRMRKKLKFDNKV